MLLLPPFLLAGQHAGGCPARGMPPGGPATGRSEGGYPDKLHNVHDFGDLSEYINGGGMRQPGQLFNLTLQQERLERAALFLGNPISRLYPVHKVDYRPIELLG